MTRMSQSVLYQLLSARLGRDVGEVIGKARQSGESWSDLEFRIRSEAGVSVTYETLRKWHLATATEGD